MLLDKVQFSKQPSGKGVVFHSKTDQLLITIELYSRSDGLTATLEVWQGQKRLRFASGSLEWVYDKLEEVLEQEKTTEA